MATPAALAGLLLMLAADLIPLNGLGKYESILVARSYFPDLITLSDVIARVVRPVGVLILLGVLMLAPIEDNWRGVLLGAMAAAATVELLFFLGALIEVQDVVAFWVGLVGCSIVISAAMQELRARQGS